MSTRIEIIDLLSTPAVKGDYPGPFKQIQYEVRNTGAIRFTIVKELNLMNYDVGFAKVVSKLRRVQINIFETINGKEYPIRSLKCNFVNYLLNEVPNEAGEIERDEILTWEVTDIL